LHHADGRAKIGGGRVATAISPEADIGLLQRIAVRDDSALAALYDRHSRLLYSLIVRILRSPLDAEDVLQETFVRVWTRAETYDPRLGSPVAWLVRIARNRAIDRRRAMNVRESVTGERGTAAEDQPLRLREAVTSDTPEARAQANATATAIREAMATLTSGQRELIEAAFFEGYTHGELSTRFGLPLGTVKTRIRAGLSAMRGRLEQFI
jgi:RNA polymerase sigma-70 factor (ECF subfamily)